MTTLPAYRTHGTHSCYSKGCRCTECREGHRQYKANLRAGIRLRENPACRQHGTVSGYEKDNCRCPRCVAAYRHEETRRRATAQAERPLRRAQVRQARLEKLHGTYNGYNNYGCRCQPCCDAGRAEARKKYWKKAGTLSS